MPCHLLRDKYQRKIAKLVNLDELGALLEKQKPQNRGISS
jgi:hypothetical protein